MYRDRKSIFSSGTLFGLHGLDELSTDTLDLFSRRAIHNFEVIIGIQVKATDLSIPVYLIVVTAEGRVKTEHDHLAAISHLNETWLARRQAEATLLIEVHGDRVIYLVANIAFCQHSSHLWFGVQHGSITFGETNSDMQFPRLAL